MDFVPATFCKLVVLMVSNNMITAVAGSKYDCESHLASSLTPNSFSSSSELSSSHNAGFAKLNRRDGAGGWSPLISNKYQWLQIDLGERKEITAIATQGKYGSSDWVTNYILMLSDTGHNWKQYHQEESVLAFIGNTNADSVVQHKLQNHIRARFLRFVPVGWNSHGRIGMRVEIYGCAYRSDVVYLDGQSSILYRFQQKSMSTMKDMISLKFKTMQSDGIILHGEGQNGDHITMELVKGTLSLIIHLGNVEFHPTNPHVNVSLGSLLDDQQWHSVVIERFGKQVNFTVDRHVHHFYMKGEIYYLDIDYELSFGGIPSQGKSASMQHTNFHGCFENLYYNGVNIIDLAKRHKPQIEIVGNESYMCLEPQVVPVTFVNSKSYLILPVVSQEDELAVSFQFRTWNREGFLFSTNLGTLSFSFILYISDGKVKFSLFKHGKSYSDISSGYEVNNGQWHSVSFMAKRNRASVLIDNDASLSLQTTLPFQVLPPENYYFGGCPENNSYNGCMHPVKHFLGCMKLISIGAKVIDLLPLQQGLFGNFSDLQIDVCGIIDRCFPNYCEHGGVCSQTWNDFYCNCSDTGYKGATCHHYTAITVINHNNTELNRVKSSNRENPHAVNFKYTADSEQIQATINNAEHCKQELAYHCKKSRILHKHGHIPFSWWVGRTNETQFYWSGSSSYNKKCSCGLEGNCIEAELYCNCDADKNEWTNDTGFLSNKDHLPVMQIVITDTDRPHSEAAYKLGPLLCWGDRSFWNSVTFTTVSSYLHFPTLKGEYSADISFFFKTSSPTGIFLENLGIRDFIRIELQSATEVLFSFDVGNGPIEVIVQSPTHLNDNQWHYVRAERNVKESSLQVDHLPQKTYSSPSDGHNRLQLNSQLYIGGTASRQKGLQGCIRSLKLNGVPVDLEERAKMTPDIKPGCSGHCSSYGNLCHNDGKCMEKHNGFSCDCSFSAYTGTFCKKEISAYFAAGSSVTYNFQDNYTISKNSSLPASAAYMDTTTTDNISFNFRTTQAPCLLLFISFTNKDYFSVIISKNGTLQIRYMLDHLLEPDVFNINMKGLADGYLHRVKLLRKQETLFVEVDTYATGKFILSSNIKFTAIQSLLLGKISVENNEIDPETRRACTNGFTGCLSAMRVNHIFPLKLILNNKLTHIAVKGQITESNCGSISGADVTSSEANHSFSDHSRPKDEGDIIASTIKSDSAIIGGIISVVVFILLCITAIAVRIYLQKNTYKQNEAKAAKNEDHTETATTLKTEISMQNAIDESQKEYFF
uniref:Contactin associated protein family member 4 n=1 Tax=Leptobrachium leishanense TaxID=445787 RepID=A0A8C5LL93_9ANUR